MYKKTFRLFLIAVAAVVAIFATPQSAHAQQKKVTYYGTISELSSSGPFWSGARVGDPFTVTVLFDMSPSSADPAGAYQWSTGTASLTAEFGSYSFTSYNLQAYIWDVYLGHGFTFSNSDAFTSGGAQFRENGLQVALRYRDPVTTGGTSLDAIAIYPLEDAEVRHFSMQAESSAARAYGAFTSYSIETIETVPEPSTWALIGIGGATLAFVAIRRRVA